MMRVCTKCKVEKELDFFYTSPRFGYRHWCKSCCSTSNTQWSRKNKESTRNTSYKTTYGITLKDVELLYELQERQCKICKKPLELTANGKNNVVHVDHCHTTGKVRGLLCSKCNSGLGMFVDSTLNLTMAIIYLNESRQ